MPASEARGFKPLCRCQWKAGSTTTRSLIFECYFRRRNEFVDDHAAALLGRSLHRFPRGKALLRIQLDHCERIGYLGRALSRAPEHRPFAPKSP
jgi:hypothetical protein